MPEKNNEKTVKNTPPIERVVIFILIWSLVLLIKIPLGGFLSKYSASLILS